MLPLDREAKMEIPVIFVLKINRIGAIAKVTGTARL
jgi:hypothetical protein